ncbi:Cytochrome c biogenesis protein CcsA [Lacunisphaera limnophila]|uniref:Cytochrome c biogenesis protein CcsA n=1 Tax=Lacunisphaera limnophila TaxID=1838286 RepID=A0A1I7PHE3_9BACT|nr:cytochrome c biogenesis protein CcsA [Lacunisphaera limnophila]AOS43021.1 Cytochrome c biogenesis protein CcsA [Lacunisphaera limnophila]
MSSLPTDRALLWLGALLYLAGFLTGLLALLRRSSATAPRAWLNSLLVAGWISQMAGLYVRGAAAGGCPLGNTFELVQFVAWSAMVVYFFVGTAFRVSLLGLFTAGYAATLAFVSLLIPQWDGARSMRIFGNNPWIELHAALAVFSYGVFGLLALTSIMQLLQNWSLKHKRLNGLFWFLPSVVQLDQINTRMLALGVLLLTISLGVGSVWFRQNMGSVDQAKLVVTVGVWAAYLGVFLLRWRTWLVSVRFAWVCLVMFILALLSLGPVNSSRNHAIVLTPDAR